LCLHKQIPTVLFDLVIMTIWIAAGNDPVDHWGTVVRWLGKGTATERNTVAARRSE
jgi:hypothetical protein